MCVCSVWWACPNRISGASRRGTRQDLFGPCLTLMVCARLSVSPTLRVFTAYSSVLCVISAVKAGASLAAGTEVLGEDLLSAMRTVSKSVLGALGGRGLPAPAPSPDSSSDSSSTASARVSAGGEDLDERSVRACAANAFDSQVVMFGCSDFEPDDPDAKSDDESEPVLPAGVSGGQVLRSHQHLRKLFICARAVCQASRGVRSNPPSPPPGEPLFIRTGTRA